MLIVFQKNNRLLLLKDGSRLVYQQIDPPQDVIKLIKEVANIDLDLPAHPHRRKEDPEV